MLRSWMFIPGNKDKHLKKAKELPADVLVFDLEDSVLTREKEDARVKVKSNIQQLTDRTRFVRVNEISSSHFIQDIKQLVSSHLTGIIIPKVNSSEDIAIADYLLKQIEHHAKIPIGSVSVVPLIETATGLYNAYSIASVRKRVSCMAFGAEDFMLDLNIDSEVGYSDLSHARSKLLTVSKAAGINAPIDSVYTEVNDEFEFEKNVLKGKQLGFQGKLLIHPKQIEIANRIFQPTDEQIKKAQKIVRKYEASEYGSIEVDGKMIDTPIIERAKRILSYVDM